jgi:MFS family permease
VPAFKYLTVAILLMTITDTVIEFRFLRVADIVFPSPDNYQQFYGLYRLGVVLAAFAIQMLLTSRIIDKLGLKNSFLVMPIALLAGAAIMLVSPGLGAATTAMVLMRLARDTVDDSALKAFNGLVPEERRGRVSMFIESYVVAAAVILGCLLAGVIVFIGIRFSFRSYHVAYLVLGGLASVAAIWAVFRMRSVYDSSMFNWRLKRRQRAASVLDKLDF